MAAAQEPAAVAEPATADTEADEAEAAPSPWSIPLTISDLGDLDDDHEWQPGELPAWANEPDEVFDEEGDEDEGKDAEGRDAEGKDAEGKDAESEDARGEDADLDAPGSGHDSGGGTVAEPVAADAGEAVPAAQEQPPGPVDAPPADALPDSGSPDDLAEPAGPGPGPAGAGDDEAEVTAAEVADPAGDDEAGLAAAEVAEPEGAGTAEVGKAAADEAGGDDSPGPAGSGPEEDVAKEGEPGGPGASHEAAPADADRPSPASSPDTPDGAASLADGPASRESGDMPAGPGSGEMPAGANGGPAGALDVVTIVPGVARYHRTGCILIRYLADGDLETANRQQAEARGCLPCRACEPEKAAPDGE